jgi:hypothetical protein
MSDIEATASPSETLPKADKAKPPADATAVFLRVEKYLQGALDELDGLTDSSSASFRGAIATALREMLASKPGGVLSP